MTKLLVQLKPGFKRTVKWNRYSSQMTIQSNNNNLNYLADSLFCHSKKWRNIPIKDKRDSFFTLSCTKHQNKRFQCFHWWKKFLWLTSKKWRRNLRQKSLRWVKVMTTELVIFEFCLFQRKFQINSNWFE